MKFCVIQIDDGRLLGSEFEKPYSYSEYTYGGGEFNRGFVDKKYLTQPPASYDYIHYVVSIFENEEKANKYIKDNLNSGWDYNFKIVNLKDL